MKKKEIFELIEKFQDANISLLEYEDAEGRLRLEKGQRLTGVENENGTESQKRSFPKSGETEKALKGKDEYADSPENKVEETVGRSDEKRKSSTAGEDNAAEIIKAPLVGVFYRAANPESKPFAEIGKKIKRGQPLCIIEAMKVMNEIKAPWDLIVKNIMGIDGEMVDCATEIFEVERC